VNALRRNLVIKPTSIFIDVVFWFVALVTAFIAESLGVLWGYAIGETEMMDRRLVAFRCVLADMIAGVVDEEPDE
jgi:hypothetical protein